MPTYEYKCKKCGHRFEIVQKITDKPLRRCRRCRGQVIRLLSPAAFILKGTGWYQTDYPKKGKDTKPEPKEEKPPEAKPEPKKKIDTIDKTKAT